MYYMYYIYICICTYRYMYMYMHTCTYLLSTQLSRFDLMCYVSTIMQQVHLCVDTCLLLNPSRGLYVGGLTDSLANISEEELKKLFSPFGHWDLFSFRV